MSMTIVAVLAVACLVLYMMRRRARLGAEDDE
jgi:hypothetical protein